MSRAEGAPTPHEPSLSRSVLNLSDRVHRGIWLPLRSGKDRAEAIRVVRNEFGTHISHSTKVHPIIELCSKESVRTASLLTADFTIPPLDFIERRPTTVSASWDYGILSSTTTGGEVGSYSTVLQSPRPGAQKMPNNLTKRWMYEFHIHANGQDEIDHWKVSVGTYTTEGAVARDAANIIRDYADWEPIEPTEPDKNGYRNARGRFASDDEVKEAMKVFTDGGINFITNEVIDISRELRDLRGLEHVLRQLNDTL